MAVDFWSKNKQKEDDVNKLFVGGIFCREVSKIDNKEDPEEWLGDSSVSLHTTYTKKNLNNVEECNIDATV